MKLSPRCVLFDLDGTLIDTAPDLGGAANQVREALQMEPLPLDAYRFAASGGSQGMLGVALGVTPQEAGYAGHKEMFLKFYAARLSRSSAPFPGVLELLARLEADGIRWGIVTNKPGWLTGPLVAALRLAERSACVVSGDTTPHPKPSPEPLFHACKLLQLLPRDCCYVGDDERDIRAGRAAGMPTIAAAWGYLGSNPNVESWAADMVVDSPAGLLEQIARRHAA